MQEAWDGYIYWLLADQAYLAGIPGQAYLVAIGDFLHTGNSVN